MAVTISSDCAGCGVCVDACPVGALSVDTGVAVVNADECIECEACIDECPCEAISL